MIALVGLRSGSVRVPHKNLLAFAGKPLCYWVLKNASKSKLIKQIYVLVDCKEYKKIVNGFRLRKVKVLMEKTIKEGGNTNLPYQFMKDFPEIEFDSLCFLQAPCPFLTFLDEAINVFLKSKNDSQLCIVKMNRFFWHDYGYPKNYKVFNRPKTQEMQSELVEVGACYITTKASLKKQKNFLGGKIGLFEIPEYNYFELDNELDYTIMQAINEKLRILK